MKYPIIQSILSAASLTTAYSNLDDYSELHLRDTDYYSYLKGREIGDFEGSSLQRRTVSQIPSFNEWAQQPRRTSASTGGGSRTLQQMPSLKDWLKPGQAPIPPRTGHSSISFKSGSHSDLPGPGKRSAAGTGPSGKHARLRKRAYEFADDQDLYARFLDDLIDGEEYEF